MTTKPLFEWQCHQRKAKTTDDVESVDDSSSGSSAKGLGDSTDSKKHDDKRRKTILGGAISSLPLFFSKGKEASVASAATTSISEGNDEPIADFPMRR